MVLIDCTLRDGGYYNAWDFAPELINDYLAAMKAVAIDYVELGFRSFDTGSGFRGACAFTTDEFIRSLNIPTGLKIGVMMNAAEVVRHPSGPLLATQLMFGPACESPVSLVRFACHLHEFEATLPACEWLKQMGYTVGINLMQIADRTDAEVVQVARAASRYDLDALYFADSMGSMDPEATARIVQLLKSEWNGALGIHTHDNMGMAVSNSIRAIQEGVSWIDSTVTGMGRGPGNAQTEYLVIELHQQRAVAIDMTPLLRLIRQHFQPMKTACGWGINSYYYLAGKYGIHPTYVQEMMADSRFTESDILAVIEQLRRAGGKKYSPSLLEAARNAFQGEPGGTWAPMSIMEGREVLILGAGAGVARYRAAIESYTRRAKPLVIALNCIGGIDEALIELRAACHPMRLMADAATHARLPQMLVTPVDMLAESTSIALAGKQLRDFGLRVQGDIFEFHPKHAVVPSPLVIAYVLALAASGTASRILLAGFDGFSSEDPRRHEMEHLLKCYMATPGSAPVLAVTPTVYDIPCTSIYAI